MGHCAGDSCCAPYREVAVLSLLGEQWFTSLEARYFQINFGQLSMRIALNLVYDCLRESYAHDKEEWNRSFAPIFDPREGDLALENPEDIAPLDTVISFT